jgi:hypothetical protein
VPALTPVTTPLLATVASRVSALLHTPPVVLLLSNVAEPSHNDVGPLMAATVGSAFTVMEVVTVVVQPKLLVAV